MMARVMACLPLLLLTCSSASAAEAKAVALNLHPIETKLIEYTNAERARHGLRPLVIDASLITSARQHTSWMCRSGQLRHTNQNVAENIAMGQSSVSEAIRSWMSSPGHRANMLSPRYTRIGVAAYRIGNGPVFWCQQFMW